MSIEARSNSAPFRRAEQLKRWEDFEKTYSPSDTLKDKKFKIKFSDSCIFLAACAASDLEEVERLLKQGTDINTANVDGLTALHQACIDNNLDMVQFLVEHECDVNRGDNEGWTPLHATASCGFLSIAKYLIEKGANVAAVNNDSDLPIDIAELTEMEDYLSDVLDNQEIDCDEARNEEERIMLADAKTYLDSPLDMNEKVHPRTGAYPLHVASAKGYISTMKILIEVGADLNAQDNDGWTPLHAAAHWCQKEAAAVLAESLANMDIQNFAGQTCFDVADPEILKLLDELKMKQASMQKDRPEIQAILQRTSNIIPPFKRRTSVTRMSGIEKSKSVIKDTKSERAQIKNLTLSEEECEEDKMKSPKKIQDEQIDENHIKKEIETEKVPTWKKFLRRSADEEVKIDNNVPEIMLKRPKKLDNEKDETSNEDHVKKKIISKYPSDLDEYPSDIEMSIESPPNRPIISPVRDEESESQRKAHAKRVRETRRSTQGVLLEDIKSAELQYLISTQQEAAVRQAEESKTDSIKIGETQNNSSQPKINSTLESKDKPIDHVSTKDKEVSDISNKFVAGDKPTNIIANSTFDGQSITLPLPSKSSGSSPDDASPVEGKASLATQAAIQRRRRPKRRSTGVVYLDSDEAQDDKDVTSDKDLSSSGEQVQGERSRHRYGSTSDAVPEGFRNNNLKIGLADQDFKKLYDEIKKENEQLREKFKNTKEELENTKKQLQKLSQGNTASEVEKQERRSLERQISEMEEELKQFEKLRNDNKRLKDENSALIRVISRLSQ